MMDERFKNPLEHTEKMEALLKKTTEELRIKSREYREANKEQVEDTLEAGKEKVRDLFNQGEDVTKESLVEQSQSETIQEIEEVLEEYNPTEIEDETLEHIEYHATEEEDRDEPDAYTNNEDLEVEEQITAPTINDKFQENKNADILNDDVPQVIRPEAIFADDVAQVEVVVEENIEGIDEAQSEVLAVIDNLRNLNFARDFSILMYALSFPLILLLVWQFIQVGYAPIMLVAIPLIIFFLIYRSSVKRLVDSVYNFKSTLQSTTLKAKEELFTKIDYVDAGIDLNNCRANYTQILYMIFTPFLFYVFAVLWKGPFDWITTLYLFGIGYLISLIVWPMAFKRDKNRLEELRTEVFDIKRRFL